MCVILAYFGAWCRAHLPVGMGVTCLITCCPIVLVYPSPPVSYQIEPAPVPSLG